MIAEDVLSRVRVLRENGGTPKEIARVTGLRPAEVTRLLRTMAVEAEHGERAVAGCWLNPGWSAGLSVQGRPDWPVEDSAEFPEDEPRGLVMVLIARDAGRRRVSVCGYLVDVFCLGVKNVREPEVMDAGKLPEFVRAYFAAFGEQPLEVPIDLARHVVFGAVDYARTLGFEPDPGFNAVSAHLGEWIGPSAVTFGMDGQPFFIQGPHDDSPKVLKTLRSSAGEGNFRFLAAT
jgi:hypothetical protein